MPDTIKRVTKKRVTKKKTTRKKAAKKVTKKVTKKTGNKNVHRKSDGLPVALKYKPEFNKQATKLARLGATNIEMAEFFEISESTFDNWRNRYPNFRMAVQAGKIIADAEVADKLFKKATGFKLPDHVVLSHKGEHTDTVKLKKHLPPDTVAAIFWLKNRRPDLWRDKQEIDSGPDLTNAFMRMAQGLPD